MTGAVSAIVGLIVIVIMIVLVAIWVHNYLTTKELNDRVQEALDKANREYDQTAKVITIAIIT